MIRQFKLLFVLVFTCAMNYSFAQNQGGCVGRTIDNVYSYARFGCADRPVTDIDGAGQRRGLGCGSETAKGVEP